MANDDFPQDDRTRAALELIGSRISGGAAQIIAEHLPDAQATALRARPRPSDEGEPGGATDLTADLAQRAGIDTAEAAEVLHGTLRAIAERVPDEKLARVRDQLTPELSGALAGTDEDAPAYRTAEAG